MSAFDGVEPLLEMLNLTSFFCLVDCGESTEVGGFTRLAVISIFDSLTSFKVPGQDLVGSQFLWARFSSCMIQIG